LSGEISKKTLPNEGCSRCYRLYKRLFVDGLPDQAYLKQRMSLSPEKTKRHTEALASVLQGLSLKTTK
jgi:hypothetical protein